MFDPVVANPLRSLSERDLANRTQQLARDERATTIELLHHLNEIARRKLYFDLGYSSLHDYCTRGLSYSSPAACRRIRAARCIREFPSALELLESGDLDLGTLALIEPILTEDNHGAVVERVRGRTYRQVKRVVAEFGPVVVMAEERIGPVRVAVTPADIDAALFDREINRAMPHGSPRDNSSWVVSEQKTLVQFLASDEIMEAYEKVKALLSHRHPDAAFAEVLGVLLKEFIERHDPEARQRRREKHRPTAATTGKSSTVGADGGVRDDSSPRCRSSRHVPAETRDAVFARDSRQCTYVALDGTRCGSTRALEIDHIRPVAMGGGNNAENLRTLCAAHNRLAAEVAMGRQVMTPYWRRE